MEFSWLSMGLFTLACTIPMPGIAQNLLLNGDLVSSYAGWTPGGSGSASHDAASGSPDPGSVFMTLSDPSGSGSTESIQQCVAVTGNTPYLIAGRGLKAASSSAFFDIVILGQFFDSADCSGVATARIANETFLTAGVPGPFSQYSTSTAVSPPGAQSLRFSAQLQTVGPGNAQGWVDHLEVINVLFANGFDP